MSKSLLKNTYREILNTKARFISILLIVALGVGFFVGVKCTNPSMVDMANRYYSSSNLMDYRLLSTVGFDEDDVKEIGKISGVSSVMPSHFADVPVESNGTGEIIRLMSVPKAYEDNEEQNSVILINGRLPENSGEIAVQEAFFADFKIGDTIKFEDKIGDTDTKDQLKTTSFKVVGTVTSPMYISFERGTTTVGNGKLDAFSYIIDEDFSVERYTELYVRLENSKNLSPFTDEYKELIDEYKEKIEKVSDKRIEVFKVDNIDKARNELDENKKKYEDEKEKANKELADAKRELDEGESKYYSELSSARTQINNAENSISYYEGVLLENKDKYEKGYEEYNEKFDAAKKELDENQKKYDDAYKSFEENEKAQALDQIDTLKGQAVSLSTYSLSSVILMVPGEKEELINNLNSILYSISYDNSKSSLESAKTLLEAEGLYELSYALDSAITNLDSIITGVNTISGQLDAAEAQFKEQKAKLDMAYAQYESEKAKYKAELDSAKEELDNAEKEIENSKAQVASAKVEYEKGRVEGLSKLQDGKRQYEDGKKEADEKLSEAKEKLDDAEEELNKVKDPKWYIFNRDDNPGYSTFIDNCDRVDRVAYVFPLFFLLVAMLVCLTTMTRLVEEKRVEIGSFKALGYSNTAITMKFVLYSSLAAFLGCIVGCALGIPILPKVIYSCYHIMYDMPDINIIIDKTSLIIGIIASIIACVFVSIAVAVKTLRGKPASLMRPKAPKKGKRILLEKIKFVWDRFNFTSKVTARNLFRYKSRLFMTVIGIAGCTALIVAGFGLYDSISDIVKIQFNDISKYNITIVSDGNDGDFTSLLNTIKEDDRIEDSMLFLQKAVTISSDKVKISDDVYLSVPENEKKISDLIELRNRVTKEHLDIEENKVILSEKLAKLLKVKVGDTIYLDNNEENPLEISGICECYIYSYVYMSPSTCRNVYDKDFKFNMVLANAPNMTDEKESEISTDYLNNDDVIAVNVVSSNVKSFEDMISSMKLVTLVLVVCAGALCMVVLYNLTNINLAERKREIATLKVLGFKHNETAAFVYRENMILTILGIVLGLFLGTWLTMFIVQTVEVDKVMFGRNIYFMTYLLAALFTLLFSILVNFIMYFRIKKINMVESLKFIE